MNKKSFFCGVIVGVITTWALSFYLYYSLNSDEPSKLLNLQKDFNIFNFEDESEEKFSNSIDDSKYKLIDGKSSYIKSRMRKEKEKRKISQKLIDELTPVLKQDPEYGLIRNAEDQLIRDNGYKTHAFNVLVSNQIGNSREIPDTRHKM